MTLQPHVPVRSPTIAIVGEAPGEQEELAGKPFVGAAGRELTELLRAAKINRQDCYITNVFWERPRDNKLDEWLITTRERSKIKDYDYPIYSRGKYFAPWALECRDKVTWKIVERLVEKFSPELTPAFNEALKRTVLDRLRWELRAMHPNVIVALGNTACWALIQNTGIKALRGRVYAPTMADVASKIIPTYHPAAMLRNYEYRPIIVADFLKARRESSSNVITVADYEIWVDPDLEDLEKFWHLYMKDSDLIVFDIETEHSMIACIGFACGKKAIVVPFSGARSNGSYWRTLEAEEKAWLFVRKVLGSNIPKAAQNGQFDMQYLWQTAGLKVNNYRHDTMILHHALLPEWKKDLGLLGSLYTNAPAWKGLCPKGLTEMKEDD